MLLYGPCFLWLAVRQGLVDSLSGGGGLITVPTLLAIGLPPSLALGTNKFQGCVGEINASLYFIRKKQIQLKTIVPGLLAVAVGTTLGTFVIQRLHEHVARQLIPWLLLCIMLYTFFSPKMTNAESKQRLSAPIFYAVFGVLIGFYNGFFGPGTGSIWIFVFMFFLGFTVVKATIYTKPLNFTGNVLSLIWFVVGGNVNYSYALVMSAGQLLGSWLGARIVMEKGVKWIRPLYLIVVTIMVVSLFLRHGIKMI